MSKWKGMRISLLVFVAIFSSFISLVPRESPPQEWDSLIIIFSLVALALPTLVGIQLIRPSTQKSWPQPGWDTDPFNFREPLNFFHLAAYVLSVQGGVDVIRILISKQTFYPGVVMPLVLGLAMFLGVKLSVMIYRSRFV